MLRSSPLRCFRRTRRRGNAAKARLFQFVDGPHATCGNLDDSGLLSVVLAFQPAEVRGDHLEILAVRIFPPSQWTDGVGARCCSYLSGAVRHPVEVVIGLSPSDRRLGEVTNWSGPSAQRAPGLSLWDILLSYKCPINRRSRRIQLSRLYGTEPCPITPL